MDGSLSKYKERICCHRGQQEYGVNYWETYAPVVNQTSVRVILILSKIHALESKSIDFTLAYSQADAKIPIFLYPPQGIDLKGRNHNKVLKLNKNLYRLRVFV